MALLKAIEVQNSGLYISYWRTTHRLDDYQAEVLEVTFHGYRDADARHQGKSPLANVVFRFGPQDFPDGSLHDVTLTQVYEAVLRAATNGQDEVNPLLGATSL